ncbi:MAG: hypothetical protein LBL59_04850 [Xanthomonadaceae bacterium]|nr:hypothetical protein [Xanthomonadaceae bacterium]
MSTPMDLLLKRYLLAYAVMRLPVVGWIAFLAYALCIFRRDRRCLHDLIAGIRVVR